MCNKILLLQRNLFMSCFTKAYLMMHLTKYSMTFTETQYTDEMFKSSYCDIKYFIIILLHKAASSRGGVKHGNVIQLITGGIDNTMVEVKGTSQH